MYVYILRSTYIYVYYVAYNVVSVFGRGARSDTQILGMTEAPGKRSVKADQITYGPFEDVAPSDGGEDMRVHYVSDGTGTASDQLCAALCLE